MENYFSLLLNQTYVMHTKKNCLNETILLRTQKTSLS